MTTRLIASMQWERTPLGPRDRWPTALRIVVQLMLDSKVPQYLVWGPQQTLLYNDGYLPLLGQKHPDALGRALRDVHAEFWPQIESMVGQVYAGSPVFNDNQPVDLDRGRGVERVWVSYAYTPIRDDAGAVAGYQCVLFDNTTRVQAEQSRNEELASLRTMFEEAPGFIALLVGPEHAFELANGAYLRLVGKHDIIGRTVRDVLPEVTEQGFIQLLDDVYASGQPYVGRRVPVELRRDDGDTTDKRFVDFVYQPIRGADGVSWGIFVEGFDVTDQVKNEDELREMSASMAAAARVAEDDRARLDALLQAAPVGIGYAGLDGGLQLVNEANFRLWGHFDLSRTVEQYGEWKAWWADASSRHGARLQAHEWGLARALRGESVSGDIIEIEPFDAPGFRKTVLLRAAPVRDSEGCVTGGVVAQVDITEQVAAEARLRESEARFRTITDAMPQMVWSTRSDGYADYFNRQWYAFTGGDEGSSEGISWVDCLHPADQERAGAHWRLCAATGSIYEIEYRMRHHTGDYRWVLARGLPVLDDGGAIVRWMGTCTDIHEHKMARAALEQSESALRLADRRKDEFLAMLAHELRNPLAPIRTAAEIVVMPRATPEQTRSAAQVIRRQVGHMTELVDDLLDVSRVTRGQVTLDRSVFDLRDAVHGAIEQVRPLIESKAHALTVRVVSEPLPVDGDRTRLTQVIANLLNNAAKYTLQGGHISIDARRNDATIDLTVEDDGLGIEPSLLPCIFDLFTQGDRTLDRAQGGLGIGLALVRGLVDLHRGRVAAFSEGAALGSRFVVTLPVAAKVAEAPDVQVALHGDPRAGVARRVIVVDDNIDAASTIAVLLNSEGHRVSTFGSAEELLGDASASGDVYILDIGLPGISGLELASLLRARRESAGALIIALSGYGQGSDRAASAASGVDHHLVKPIDADTLIATIASDGRSAKPENQR